MTEPIIEQRHREAAKEAFRIFNDWIEKLLRFSDVPKASELEDALAQILAKHFPGSAVEQRFAEAGVEFCSCGHLNIEHYAAADWQTNPNCAYYCGVKICDCKRFKAESNLASGKDSAAHEPETV